MTNKTEIVGMIKALKKNTNCNKENTWNHRKKIKWNSRVIIYKPNIYWICLTH